MDILSQIFKQPEYLHMRLHPMLVYGLFMGVLALALALLIRSRAAISVALFLIFFAAATGWPTYHYGEAG